MTKLTIMLFCTLAFVACKKENKSSDKVIESTNKAFLTATINGVNFHTDAPIYFSAQNIITLAAVSKDKSEKIRIYINYINGPTTYIFGKGIPNSDNMVYTKDKVDWLAAKTDGEGTITFKEEGGYLTATFSFTGINKETKKTLQITEGKFRVLKK